MPKSKNYTVAVDIGGTFTDAVIADYENKRFIVTKTSSTAPNPAVGFFTAVDSAQKLSKAKADEIKTVFHGSTVVTNAILESKGAKTALFTTRGFRHLLDIGRAEIPREENLYSWKKPIRPLRPRDIFEVDERIRSDGSIATELDTKTLEPLLGCLKEGNYKAVAISFLHSYINPNHERLLRDFLCEFMPELEITTSSDVLPVFREYERSMITVMNAMVQPLVGRYIRQLEENLDDRGIHAPMFIMKSNGGVFRPEEAARSGAHMALSGPAAGANGASFLGQLCGLENMITLDMGGTSTDIALIQNGQPKTTSMTRINGLPLALPVIDILTIGAGGGSIASIAENGAILVGPQSAGACPGPACYGKGGKNPTVTDANLVLGRLPAVLLDGALKLDLNAATSAIKENIADPLSTSIEEAALGILAIVNETMSGALKLMTVERGLDPAQYTLVAFGGAGPVHGGELMRLLNSRQQLIPRYPGILCATGLLSTDLRYDFVQTKLQRFGKYNVNEITKIYETLESQAKLKLADDKIPAEKCDFKRSADLRYTGQGTELNVILSNDLISDESLKNLVTDFHDLHRQLYSFSASEKAVEIVNFRVSAIGKMEHIAPLELARADKKIGEPDGLRLAVIDKKGLQKIPFWRRERLLWGHQIQGPAIIDQLDTTTVIFFGQSAEVDRWGNILVTEQHDDTHK